MIEETLPFIFMDFIIFHTQTLCLGYNVFLQIFTLNFFFLVLMYKSVSIFLS